MLVQVLLSTGIIIMAYLLGRNFFSRREALVAAGLCAVDPHNLSLSVHLLSDTLFVFVFLSSIIVLMYGLKNKKVSLFFLSGILLGMATIIRPVTQYFPIAGAVIILLYPEIKFILRSKAAVCFVLAFFVIVSPWMYRNYVLYNHFSLSTAKGFNLLKHHAAFTKAAITGESVEQARREFAKEAQRKGVNDSNPFYLG
ncbi:MAG: glycosyltransferase family 39 protein [Deltaproteobacteria bacterium]|nr:glycosyltransferase family 39 protein [Deltaproteobacteria bacterium]